MMKLDILAIAAHPDDVELSASGTLISHVAKGRKVGVVDLTRGELGTRGSAELRAEEAAAASEIMGLSARENLGMADGFFENSKVNQLKVIEQLRRFQPDIVLCNAVSDRHPDHGKGAELAAQACFLSGLRKVETQWSGTEQEAWRPKAVYHYIQDHYHTPDFVVDITENFQQKMEAIKAFKSQFYDPNSKEPDSPISGKSFLDFIEGRAAQYGRLISRPYGEGFTVARSPGVTDLFQLL